MNPESNHQRHLCDAKVLSAFRKILPRWFASHKRDLPWRHTRDPYAITISEFMLQQTQVSTVIPYYHNWLKKFPNWQSLAAAPLQDALKAWEGLGYYRRARHAQALAQTIINDHHGTLPHSPAELRKLPGIGPYMAGAIASIAFEQKAALVDGNVERVLARVFNDDRPTSDTRFKRSIWQLAESLLPDTNIGDYNQALMELGATVCLPRKPRCHACPLSNVCRATDPQSLPNKSRPAITAQDEQIAIIRKGSCIWLLKPGNGGRWPDFHRLPLLDDKIMHRGSQLLTHHYSITRYRVTAHVLTASFISTPPQNGIWCSPAKIKLLTLPAPHRKIISQL